MTLCVPFGSQILSSPKQLAEFGDLERTTVWTTPEKQAPREVFETPEMARRPSTVAKVYPCNISCSLCPNELGARASGKPRHDIELRGHSTCSKGCQHDCDTKFTPAARQKVREQRHAVYSAGSTRPACMDTDCPCPNSDLTLVFIRIRQISGFEGHFEAIY
jgi:hypothetical protein